MEAASDNKGKGQEDKHVVGGNRGRATSNNGSTNNGGVSSLSHGNQHGYNPGHDRGGAYGGYARGWQRQSYRGYHYGGSHFSANSGHGGGEHSAGRAVPRVQAPINLPGAVG
jgi:hypothetical protein